MGVTPQQLLDWKRKQRPIVALTAWDYSLARILDSAGVDLLLVGDSLAMVALGYENTLPVSLDAMLHHAAAVRRGATRAMVVCDLPFLSYQESLEQAIHSAGRALKEAGVQGVKLEGGSPEIVATVDRLTRLGIPVMGHVGLTPQSVYRLGYKQQGRSEAEAQRIMAEAIALSQAGAFAIILEHIPTELAALITEKIPTPTIGIGAGNPCDGQILVTADLLGLSEKLPPFAKAYLNLGEAIAGAVKEYAREVKDRNFPPQ